jgi:hypothetical protein
LSSHWEGTTFLKFAYGQLYNGKLAKRYGHVPTDKFPLCYKPDSYTLIAGECPYHEALTISRHNAACQLIHAAIRKTAKEEAALHDAPDLVLLTSDRDYITKQRGPPLKPSSPPPRRRIPPCVTQTPQGNG